MSDNDTYVVVSNGKASKPMSWDDAMGRAKHLGEFRGQDVEVHIIRRGKTAEIVASWENFKRTK